jgi:hypothetical protein
MTSNVEQVAIYGKEGPTDGTIGGWRFLLALTAWIALAVGTGEASWNGLRTRWRRGGAVSTTGCSLSSPRCTWPSW